MERNAMPLTIADIMSKKLLYLSEGDRASLARRKILEFGLEPQAPGSQSRNKARRLTPS